MKKIRLIIAILGICFASCHDLTLEPKGILGDSELFGSEDGVERYLAGLYGYLPIEDFNYYATNVSNGFRASNYWEATKYSMQCQGGELFGQWTTSINNNGFGYWPYERIREINSFIEAFPNYKANFAEDIYNNLFGEAHFIRAFFYSGLAKRYGGVPIIKTIQYPTDPPEVLNVRRDTEYDTWKFIYEDLKFAIDNLSDSKDVTRANKYTAAALMSRMMLYAGTIAKYSQYLGFQSEPAYQEGLAGIDPSKANEFFQYSYDAGKIVESGEYTLYTANYPDKELNFANLFLDRSSSENIFIKIYLITAARNQYLCHSWDALASPTPAFSGMYGSQTYPPADVFLMYDFPEFVDADNKPIRFDSRSDIRNGMEPRLRGSMFFNGDELRGSTFSTQRGLYKTFPWTVDAAKNGDNDGEANLGNNRITATTLTAVTSDDNPAHAGVPPGMRITGDHGLRQNATGENNCRTGAFTRKYVNPAVPASISLYQSTQPWIVFRLGEIYLNMAEACYELGKKTEAFDYIEKIRDRAGCKVTRPADDPTDLSQIYGYPIDGNLQFIRDERYRELWCESQRWWDLRRWRIADKVFYNWTPKILSAYYVVDEDKYIYILENNDWGRRYTANRNCYWEGIPQGQINRNINLLPNNPLR